MYRSQRIDACTQKAIQMMHHTSKPIGLYVDEQSVDALMYVYINSTHVHSDVGVRLCPLLPYDIE